MGHVSYAPLAEADLSQISEWTKKTWGDVQAGKYLNNIQEACERLAENPGLGRSHQGRRAGVRRMEQGSHVIFYEVSPRGIVVGRILHKTMMPMRQGL